MPKLLLVFQETVCITAHIWTSAAVQLFLTVRQRFIIRNTARSRSVEIPKLSAMNRALRFVPVFSKYTITRPLLQLPIPIPALQTVTVQLRQAQVSRFLNIQQNCPLTLTLTAVLFQDKRHYPLPILKIMLQIILPLTLTAVL